MTTLRMGTIIALGAALLATTAQAGAPLKGVDVKLGKAHTAQARTKALSKPSKAVAKGEPHRPISR